MKEIQLSQGKATIVDDEDFEKLSSQKWHYHEGYAAMGLKENGKILKIRMHRVIMNASKGIEVDHINGDKLDNRKVNLRLCTKHQNLINRRRAKNQSGYKGVTGTKSGNWQARIQMGKSINLGSFSNIEDAARAYDEAAKKYHGEFANLNFPEGSK